MNKNNTSYVEKEFPGKLIFTEYEEMHLAMLLRGERLIAAQVLPEGKNKVGAVYIGKVKNVMPNIAACFVEISGGELCFLPLKEASAPYLLNRQYDGRLLEGDELPVQVVTEAQKNKQASVTARLSVSNEYMALTLDTSPRVGFSRKLSPECRQELETLLTEKGILKKRCFVPQNPRPFTVSGIIRTQAGTCESRQLFDAYDQLVKELEELLSAASHRTCFSCLREAPASYEAILDNMVYPYEFEEILTDNELLYQQLCGYCNTRHPEKKVRLYSDPDYSMSKLYSLNTKLEEGLGKRVWLKSGAYLIIEPTEALTVIDVNSGKFEGVKRVSGKADQENAYRVNLEAAAEIALQLRLRNLSGIIVVDFINMNSQELDRELLDYLRKLVKKDKMKTLVIDITPLGLMEITRKKGNKPLREQLRKSK